MLPDETWVRRLAKAAGWILAMAILVLSVVPPSQRPVTGVASSNFEHLAIWFATGLAFAAAYRDRLPLLAAALLVFAAAIEIIQLFVPGRHARLSDLVLDCLATCAGVAIVAAANGIMGRGRRLES
jgi:VanZ family protein